MKTEYEYILEVFKTGRFFQSCAEPFHNSARLEHCHQKNRKRYSYALVRPEP